MFEVLLIVKNELRHRGDHVAHQLLCNEFIVFTVSVHFLNVYIIIRR